MDNIIFTALTVVLPLTFAITCIWALIKARHFGFKVYALLAVMYGFLIIFGDEQLGAGAYADAHGLSGASIGWFHPWGVIVFSLYLMIVTLIQIVIILKTLRRKRHPH